MDLRIEILREFLSYSVTAYNNYCDKFIALIKSLEYNVKILYIILYTINSCHQFMYVLCIYNIIFYLKIILKMYNIYHISNYKNFINCSIITFKYLCKI